MTRIRILPDDDKYFQIRESMKDQDKVKDRKSVV